MIACGANDWGRSILLVGPIFVLFGMLLFAVRIISINITIKNGIYKKLGSPSLLMLSDLFPLRAFRARLLVGSAVDRRWIAINFYFYLVFTILFASYLIFFIIRCV